MLGSDTYGLPILSIPHAFDFHHRLAPALGNHFLNILVDDQTENGLYIRALVVSAGQRGYILT
jgi:hypothetical protein